MEKTGKIRFYPAVFVRGILMGVADLIPGVSGGTMALITGIYERLLRALSSLDANALKLLLKGKFKTLWQHIDGNFLSSLFTGILLAVFSLSKLIHYLLETYPVPVLAFFFGLIAASAVFIIKKTDYKSFATMFFVAAGAVTAYFITRILPEQGPPTLWYLFFSGVAGSIAMILPGISGSYILVLLGSYTYVLASVHQLKILNLIVFTAGVATGLSGFSKMLKWLFNRYKNQTLALMGGFLIGSLNQVWPWKKVLETKTVNGKEFVIRSQNVCPWDFSGENYLILSMLTALTGVVLILLFEKIQKKYG
jgi:putative membrane protein